ncbi:hypothetical protein ACN2XU_04435 [Primorskyibacter sp. 2E107]|uniref:hypothetical protein n=1 Tax=Primorskyibacter sp. 2E107 TaxID=3403458 RepID=UPI003AF823FA
MARNVFYRDFTACKALALVTLMAIAALMGEMPHPASGEVRVENPVKERVLPAFLQFGVDCDKAEAGVNV